MEYIYLYKEEKKINKKFTNKEKKKIVDYRFHKALHNCDFKYKKKTRGKTCPTSVHFLSGLGGTDNLKYRVKYFSSVHKKWRIKQIDPAGPTHFTTPICNYQLSYFCN
jgi:hypothetical protein